jgi:hypothetical protein
MLSQWPRISSRENSIFDPDDIAEASVMMYFSGPARSVDAREMKRDRAARASLIVSCAASRDRWVSFCRLMLVCVTMKLRFADWVTTG